MEERNVKKIKYISFVLAIGVVFIHTYNLVVYGISTTDKGAIGLFARIEEYSNIVFNKVCVPFFFFISGYLYYRNYSWNKVWSKYKSRVKSLLIPYVLWCTLYFLIYYILTHFTLTAQYMNMEPVTLSIPYYLSCLWNSSYTALWFVKSLLITIVFTPAYFLFFSKKKTRVGNIISYFACVLLFIYELLIENQLYIPYNLPHLPGFNLFFLTGGWLSIHCSEFMEKPDKKKTISALCVGIVCLVMAAFWGKYLNAGWVLCIVLAIWFAADVFSYQKNVKWWIGQSFFIYCAHGLLLEMSEKLWLLVAGKSFVAAVLDYFFMPFLVVVILTVVAVIMNRYFKPLYLILTGGRSERG